MGIVPDDYGGLARCYAMVQSHFNKVARSIWQLSAVRLARHLLLDLREMFWKDPWSLMWHLGRDLGRYSKRPWCRKPISREPHSLKLYDEILNELTKRQELCVGDVKGLFVLSRDKRFDRVYVALRHDVDAQPESAYRMAKIEIARNIRSTFHFLVDGYEYPEQSAARVMRWLVDRGFDVGLHTAAYRLENTPDQFVEEMHRFAELLGKRPETVSLHGFPGRTQIQLDQRRVLQRFISSSANGMWGPWLVTGRLFDDNVQDSLTEKCRTSILWSEICEVNRLGFYGGAVQILTHPHLWR